jgi:hypothetical protein
MPGVLDTGVCDPDELFLILGVKRIRGFAKGQYWLATPRGPDFTADEGADGAVMLSKLPRVLWDGSITLMQSSASNDVLWDALEASRNTPGGLFHPFSMTHNSTKLVAAISVIAVSPAIGRSDGADTYVWPVILRNFDGKLRALRSPAMA